MVRARSRCTTYPTYKANLNVESHTTELRSKDIIIFAKFRCCCNHLPKASYTDVKVCTLCSKNDIDDEYYYLLKCEYNNKRNTFVEARCIKHSKKHNFQELMKCQSDKDHINSIVFINIIM